MKLIALQDTRLQPCMYCGSAVRNITPDDRDEQYCGPPVCDQCSEHQAKQYQLSLLDKVIVKSLARWSNFKHVDTCHASDAMLRFDPYAGEQLTIQLGKLQIKISTLICATVEITWGYRKLWWESAKKPWAISPFIRLLDAFQQYEICKAATEPYYDDGYPLLRDLE